MNEEEIKQEFINITELNDAKVIYKQLAKILHPDIGGSDEEFKLLNTIYTNLIENNIYFSNDTKFDIEIEKIISQLLHYENIIIEIVGNWIWLSGDTKTIKEKLKKLSFKWASKKKMWYYGQMKGRSHKQKSMSEIKSKYGYSTVRSNQKVRLSA